MSKSAIKDKKSKHGINVPRVSGSFLRYYRWILLGLMMIAELYPPFLRGLYFESEQLPTEIYILIIFILYWIYKYLKRDQTFLQSHIDYVTFVLTIVYLISIFVAVSTRGAIAEWLKYCMYFTVFFMLSDLCISHRARLLALWTIVASALGVCLLGIDGAAGSKIATSLNSLFKSFGIENDIFYGLFVGGRFNSTLQYPNALAAYVLAVYILSIGLTVASKRFIIKGIGSASSFILLLTFIFTYSRGAYLIFPIIILIFVILLPKGLRVRGVAFITPSLISVGFIYIKLSKIIEKGGENSFDIWITVCVGVILTIILSIIASILAKWMEKIKWYVYTLICITAFSVIIIGGIYVLSSPSPVVLSHEISEKDSYKSFSKVLTLEPGKECKIQIDVNSEGEIQNKPLYYQIVVRSKNERDILFNGSTQIAAIQGKSISGFETKELNIKVPSDSMSLEFILQNYAEGSKTIFDNLRIVDVNNPSDIKKVILNYKYIPDSIEAKLQNMFVSNSSLSRNIFFRDGMKIFKDYWLLGAGGGAWPIIYFSYQSYLYWTTQAHNYILQLGVETGILGLIVLALLFLSLIYSAIRHFVYRNKVDPKVAILQASLFSAICAMFMHSVIDFDLSLSAVYLMLWELIAIFNSIDKTEYSKMQPEEKNKSIEILNKLNLMLKLPDLKLSPIIGLIIILVIMVFPIRLNMGLGYQADATKELQNNNLIAALNYIKKAISADGFSTQYKLDYANYLLQQEPSKLQQRDLAQAYKYVEDSEKSAMKSPDLALKVGAFYLSTLKIDKGLDFYKRAVELRPFRPEEWQIMADVYMQVAVYYFNKGDKNNYNKYLDKTLSLFEEAKVKNSKNIGEFAFNEGTSLILEKAKYLKENDLSIDQINKLIFYSFNDIDIMGDGLPDEWKDSYEYDILENQSGKLHVKGKTGIPGSIVSRNISFVAGKTYQIDIKLSDSSKLKKMSYMISGVDKEFKPITFYANKYTSVITFPSDFKANKNSLVLLIDGECDIEYVSVFEK